MRDRIAGVRPPPIDGPAILTLGAGSEPMRHAIVPGSVPHATIEVPLDPDQVEAESLDLAIRWREATRAAFLEWIGAGYVVADSNRGKYLIARASAPAND